MKDSDYVQILREEYDKKYGSPKYDKSIIPKNFESIIISAMKRVKTDADEGAIDCAIRILKSHPSPKEISDEEAITKANKILHDLNFVKDKTTTQIVAEGLKSYALSIPDNVLTDEDIKEKIDEAQRLMQILLPPDESGDSYESESLWNILEELRQLSTEGIPTGVMITKNDALKKFGFDIEKDVRSVGVYTNIRFSMEHYAKAYHKWLSTKELGKEEGKMSEEDLYEMFPHRPMSPVYNREQDRKMDEFYKSNKDKFDTP